MTRKSYQTIDLWIFFQREIEGERGEEDDRLDVVKVRYPVLSLKTAVMTIQRTHISGERYLTQGRKDRYAHSCGFRRRRRCTILCLEAHL